MADAKGADEAGAAAAPVPVRRLGLAKPYEGPNPFVTRTPLRGCYEHAKIAIMCVLLVPVVRVLLIVLTLVFIWFFSVIATCCVRDRHAPLRGWRLLPIYPIRLLCRVVLLVAGFVWIPVRGLDALAEARRRSARPFGVIVANHMTVWDQFRIVYDTGCCVAAKAELFDVPLLGSIMRALQCVPVERNSREGRRRAMDELLRRARAVEQPPILIFPQGTTSNDLVLTSFKRGAFVGGVPVLPVALRYPNRHYDLVFSLSMSMVASILWGLCQVVNYQRVTYLPVYAPSEEEVRNPDLFADNVRARIAAELGVACTDHDFTDLQLMMEARRRRVRVRFTARQLQEHFDLSVGEVQRLIDNFHRLDADGDGALSFDEFHRGLRLRADSPVARRLFDIFDADADGPIDFADYVSAVSVATRDVSERDTLLVLFTICDQRGEGLVGEDGFDKVLDLARRAIPRPAHAGPNPDTYTLSRHLQLDVVREALFPPPDPELEQQPPPRRYSFEQFAAALDEYPQWALMVMRMLFLSVVADAADAQTAALVDGLYFARREP